MKKLLLISIALLTLGLTGCTTKQAPSVNNVSSIDYIEGETDEVSTIGDETLTMDETNMDEYGTSNMNTSKDGFKSVYFGFDKYKVTMSQESILEHNARIAMKSNSRIKIEGNCDSFGTDEYNYALGLKRAKVVKDKMVESGVLRSDMILVSMGESNPTCSSNTIECRKSNRRADFSIIR